jgi:hypothetical protein
MNMHPGSQVLCSGPLLQTAMAAKPSLPFHLF